MTALVDCPRCEGAGELVECANDGSHGCSHTYDREWTCPLCDGECSVPQELAEEYAADLAAEEQLRQEERDRAALRRPVATVPGGVDAWGPEPF